MKVYLASFMFGIHAECAIVGIFDSKRKAIKAILKDIARTDWDYEIPTNDEIKDVLKISDKITIEDEFVWTIVKYTVE